MRRLLHQTRRPRPQRAGVYQNAPPPRGEDAVHDGVVLRRVVVRGLQHHDARPRHVALARVGRVRARAAQEAAERGRERRRLGVPIPGRGLGRLAQRGREARRGPVASPLTLARGAGQRGDAAELGAGARVAHDVAPAHGGRRLDDAREARVARRRGGRGRELHDHAEELSRGPRLGRRRRGRHGAVASRAPLARRARASSVLWRTAREALHSNGCTAMGGAAGCEALPAVSAPRASAPAPCVVESRAP
mmetsp:Transcript_21056/g.62847  ORF Transcript_21056/g.62847 Transcript_21056/m.62847 type:complete len:249 (-) Transcript_21056:73-819(-)